MINKHNIFTVQFVNDSLDRYQQITQAKILISVAHSVVLNIFSYVDGTLGGDIAGIKFVKVNIRANETEFLKIAR